MLGAKDLVLCWAMVWGASFRDLVEGAATAGYRGISVSPDDYDRGRAAGHSQADMRAMLADYGLAVAEFDPVVTWLPGSEVGNDMFSRSTEELLDMADAVGARSLNAIYLQPEPIDTNAAIDGFAAFCERAAARNKLVSLEFFPWTGMPDPGTAWQIVEGAGQPNGGLMVDSWHVFRGVGDFNALRAVPGDRIFGVQLSDAPQQPAESILEETRRRLTPGEGAIDLVGLIRLLDEMGSTAPLGIEVISPVTQSQPVGETAMENARAMRRIIAEARQSAT